MNFEEFDDTMSQYSATSSMTRVSSVRSMDHPHQHQEQQQRAKQRSMRHSASEGKLPLVTSKSSISMGSYHRIDEELEVPNIKPPPRDDTASSTKRRLFKKSKGNN